MKKGVPLTAKPSVIKDEEGREQMLSELPEAEQRKFLQQMGKNLEAELNYRKSNGTHT